MDPEGLCLQCCSPSPDSRVPLHWRNAYIAHRCTRQYKPLRSRPLQAAQSPVSRSLRCTCITASPTITLKDLWELFAVPQLRQEECPERCHADAEKSLRMDVAGYYADIPRELNFWSSRRHLPSRVRAGGVESL